MCWCDPEKRTPFCGKPECHPPEKPKCTMCGKAGVALNDGLCITCGLISKNADDFLMLLDSLHTTTTGAIVLRTYRDGRVLDATGANRIEELIPLIKNEYLRKITK